MGESRGIGAMAKGAEDWVREAREVKDAMREHSPAVPVELVEYYAKKQGLSIKDPHVAKLIAVSAEEFLGRVLRDAFEMTEKMDGKGKGRPGWAGGHLAPGRPRQGPPGRWNQHQREPVPLTCVV